MWKNWYVLKIYRIIKVTHTNWTILQVDTQFMITFCGTFYVILYLIKYHSFMFGQKYMLVLQHFKYIKV